MKVHLVLALQDAPKNGPILSVSSYILKLQSKSKRHVLLGQPSIFGNGLLCAFAVEEVADDLVARLVLIDLVPCRTEEARLGLAHHRIQLGAEVKGLVLRVVAGSELTLVFMIGLPSHNPHGLHAVDPFGRHHGIRQDAVLGVQAIDLDVRRRLMLLVSEGDIGRKPLQGTLLPRGPHGRNGKTASIRDLVLLLMSRR